MKVTFLGGTETVTGSKYLLQSQSTTVLVDCGLYQGYKWLRERNWQSLPVDVDKIDAVLLTHAHLDHSGYIPVLYKNGYRGPVFTHEATHELCKILLVDSGYLQEEDARFYQKHKLGKHHPPEPLYDRKLAEDSLKLFHDLAFYEQLKFGNMTIYFQPAGHILGAASVIVEAEGRRIGFSGDVGQAHDIFMRPPAPLPQLDLLLLESTYGNREHEKEPPHEQLANIVNSTIKKAGVVLIPSFAVGRTQAVLSILADLIKSEKIPRLPTFLDSPMGIDVSYLYWKYNAYHRFTEAQCLELSRVATCTRSVEESMALADVTMPHIIIAGSGMATGGRILHHFKRLLSDHRTTVIFTGYQAGGTRGDKMINGEPHVKIHGDWIANKASIEVLKGLSGHADAKEIIAWLKHSDLDRHLNIQLVHGEPTALEAMRDQLQQETKFQVDVAQYQKQISC